MKVVARTPTELIIRDSAMGIRGFGVFVIGLGAFAIWIGAPDEDGLTVVAAMVIGSLVALGGALLVALPSRKTFAFSKTERVFIMAKQRFGRVRRQTIPIRDIADVSLDVSTSDDGSSYRVCVTLADMHRIPWTSYYTSALASQRAVVDVVREFLELDPNPGLGSGAPTAQSERDARRGRWGLRFMGAFCCVFLGIGVTMIAKEQRRLTVFQPVTATVLSTRVDEHSDSDGSTYEPVVVYRYRVNDREYTASRVTPLRQSRSGRWARRVTARYQVGGTYTAFYDPENPRDAFLLRSRSVIPWAFVGIPLVALLFIGTAISSSRELTRMSRWPRPTS